jgi:hypothetical protein
LESLSLQVNDNLPFATLFLINIPRLENRKEFLVRSSLCSYNCSGSALANILFILLLWGSAESSMTWPSNYKDALVPQLEFWID